MSDDFEVPDAKRQRLEGPSTTKPRESRLFRPFRTIGLVSPTTVPFTSVPLGQTTFQITTSVGKTLQTYDLKRGLGLVFLSTPSCPENITATCAYRDRVLVAWGHDKSKNGQGVWVFKRGKACGYLGDGNTVRQELKKLFVFGQWIIGQGPRAIEVWKSDTYEHYTTISISSTTTVTAICTLPTFLNKVIVGRSDGVVEVYNVSTGKLIHSIIPESADNGAVTCLAAPLAVSLLAVAHANGTLRIIDVETEELILHLFTEGSKPVTSISFRADGMGASDDGRSDGVMATTSTESGDVTLWDMTKSGKVAGVLRGAHEISNVNTGTGITKVEFLAGQPVIITSGLDNALKTWVFDQNPFSPIPRILHQRSGHAATISKLKFLPAASDGSDANGKWLLSAGRDRSLWGFSLRKDAQSTELSQGNVKSKSKKLGKLTIEESNVEDFKCPPIIDIACSLNRDGGMGAVGGPVWTNSAASNAEEAALSGWESVITAHDNDKYARTWFWGRKKAGRWAFETSDHKPVSSVTITACGTFALIGSQGGAVDMHNLQSGLHRQKFPAKLKPSQAKILKQKQLAGENVILPKGHTGAVTGIVVDSMNQVVMTTSLDGLVIVWNFLSAQIQAKIRLAAPATAVRYNSVSGLVSLACDDLCIRVFDMETKRIVRELWGCVGQIYDHCFSHDGRWILTSSMDSVVRVFDLATGHLIDAFRTNTCTNMAFSSTGEFLATAHAGQIGINIWNSKSLFSHISLRQIDEETDTVDLSDAAELQTATQLVEVEAEKAQDSTNCDDDDIAQIDSSLLTLSLQPQSRWQTLLNLETIRQRNKPIEPPQKPKSAPFFLGSSLANGLKPDSQDLQKIEQPSAAELSRISRLTSMQPVRSPLTTCLESFEATGDPTEIAAYMTGLSPSAADLDIRSLTLSEIPVFIQSLTARLQQRRDFELVNTWMAVMLKLHNEFVSNSEQVQGEIIKFQQAMSTEEARLGQSIGWARGVVDFLRSSR